MRARWAFGMFEVPREHYVTNPDVKGTIADVKSSAVRLSWTIRCWR